MLKIRKITVTNKSIQKCKLLHYALNHFFTLFSKRKPKNKKNTQKPCVVFESAKSNGKNKKK